MAAPIDPATAAAIQAAVDQAVTAAVSPTTSPAPQCGRGIAGRPQATAQDDHDRGAGGDAHPRRRARARPGTGTGPRPSGGSGTCARTGPGARTGRRHERVELTVTGTRRTITVDDRAMGSTLRIVVVGDATDADDGTDLGDLAGWARRRVADLESRWSRFLPDSDISRLNRHAGQPSRSTRTPSSS